LDEELTALKIARLSEISRETRLGTSICGVSAWSGGFVGRGKGEKKEKGEIRERRKMAR
jgi:hypothetical protein